MNQYIEKYKNEFDNSFKFLKKEVSSLRIGRASPALVENIHVDSYGVKTPIVQLASIATPDARSITIQPWDKSIIKNIEKGIIEANIGINPVNEGNIIRITMPHLTQEDREKLVKILQQKVEQGRIKIRLVRDKVRDDILGAEKNKNITEDDKYDFLKEIDEFTKKQNDTIEEFSKIKQKEIMSI